MEWRRTALNAHTKIQENNINIVKDNNAYRGSVSVKRIAEVAPNYLWRSLLLKKIGCLAKGAHVEIVENNIDIKRRDQKRKGERGGVGGRRQGGEGNDQGGRGLHLVITGQCLYTMGRYALRQPVNFLCTVPCNVPATFHATFLDMYNRPNYE